MLIVEQVRVGRGDCPLGGLWIRQLGGLIDDGLDRAGYQKGDPKSEGLLTHIK